MFLRESLVSSCVYSFHVKTMCVRLACLYVYVFMWVCVVKGTDFPQQEKPSSLSFFKAPHNSMSTLTAFKSPSTSFCDNKKEESVASKHNSKQGQMCVLHLTLKCHEGLFLIWDAWSQVLTSEYVSNTAATSAMWIPRHVLKDHQKRNNAKHWWKKYSHLWSRITYQ